MEKQKLIYVESKALFSPSEVSDKAIVFIKDTKEIWTHGVYFSCSGTWATPITLSLTGDTTGSVSIDGSGNASIATTTTYLSGTTGITDANNAANTRYHNIAYYPQIVSGSSNLFPVGNNANGILSLNVHDYSYTHLLGFSSNGNIYHRRRNGGTWETTWKTILNSSNYTNFHHTFASLTNKPTTLSGYGITDCIPIISGGKVTTDTDLKTLGMTTAGAKLSVFHLYEGPYPTWLNVPYMNVLMFRSTSDSYGAIGIEMIGRTVLFIGGRSLETTANNAPNWWFRIKGASGTTYDLNSFLNSINNLDSNYLRKSGGTMTGILTLTTGYAYINDTASGYSIYGSMEASNTSTGTSGLATIFSGAPTLNMVLRTSGDNLYHYNHSKSARYLILDTNNYSTYALPLSGGTMKGALNFANNTWNKVGDDAYMGDCNISGMIGIKGSNATPGFAMYNNSGTLLGKLYASGTSLYWSNAKLLTSNDSVSEAYLAWGGRNLANNPSPVDAALAPSLGANRLAFLNPDAIDIEYSLDGGTTWVDYEVTDAQKVLLFDGIHLVDLYLGGDSTQDTSIDRNSWRLRITLSAIDYKLYGEFKKFMIRVTSHGNVLRCALQGRSYSNVQNDVDTWVTFLDTLLSGWPGWNTINHPAGIIIPNTSHYGQIRFDFYMTVLGSFGVPSHIHKIMGFAPTCWTTPSNMAGYGSIYSYDWQLNVTFPAKVTATGFSGNLTGNVTGNLTGNAGTASKWKDARTITLTGDVTGSVTLDGSSNVTLATATAGTGTTSFLKCLDKRNSYPALIVTSGGNIGAAFMSASKLGLSEGNYYEALILRGWTDSSGGNDNALLFSKNTSSVYHSQYAFGSTTTWGTMYKFLDSNNYSSYALPLSGGTMTGKLTLTTNTSWIADSATSAIILGTFASGNTAEGLSSEAGVLVGKLATLVTIRSNGDDLWHYRNSDKKRYKILDAANYTNYTIPYSKSNVTYGALGAFIYNGGLLHNTNFKYLTFFPSDNLARISYVLIAKIDNWANTENVTVPTSYGINGFFTAYRGGNMANTGSYFVTNVAYVNTNYKNYKLYSSKIGINGEYLLIPQLVIYLNEYYLAFKKYGSSTSYHFYGQVFNILSSFIYVEDASLITTGSDPFDTITTDLYYYNKGNGIKKFLHEGNYSTYALPLSGGTLTGILKSTLTAGSLGTSPIVCTGNVASTTGINNTYSHLASNLATGGALLIFLGKASSSYNGGSIGYWHKGGDGSSGNALTFSLHSANNLMVILGNGNVGINNTSPSYKLDVGGDIYSSGYIRAKSGFIKTDSSDSYVLLGGGGHKLLSDLSATHTHPWSDITSRPGLLGAMANPIFYPYANDTKLGAYISTINNRFYSADLRYTVTTTNLSGSAHLLFDDNYDDRMQIDKGTTATITIEGYNFIYNNGYIILYFYLYSAYPLLLPKSITAVATTLYGTTYTLNRATSIESGNTIAFLIGLEFLTKLEFTIVSLDNAYCGITNIDYYSRRTENTARDCAVVTKYNANTLYHNLTAPKYIVSGGTSSQFLKADGSLDSNAYLPLSGGTMTGNISWNADSHGIYLYRGCGIEKYEGYGPTLISEGNNTDFYIRNNTDRTKHYKIIHAGNYSEYALKINGTNGTADGVSALLNKLTTGTATPVDADYYICQYAGGGTTTTSYHRRPMSALYTYIKSKLSLNPDERFIYATSATSNQYGTTEATGSSTTLTRTLFWRDNDRFKIGMYVQHSDNLNYGFELASGYASDAALTYRRKYSGTWETEQTVLTSSNYNSYSPTLTGTGASGTWAINISGVAASASKVANALTIQLNGGTTAGTNKFVYDGSSAYTINITPEAIGASATNHTHGYLPLSGGILGSSTASFTDLFIRSSTAKLRLTSFTDSTTYIQSGNSDFTGNATLKITGYNVNTGSNLYFNFANIYCRAGNYTNIDSGNYSSYALPKSGGTLTGTLISRDIRPSANLSYSLGTSSYYYNYVYANYFKKNGSSDSYVLLGGGGHKAVSDFAPNNVATLSSSGMGNSDLWTLVFEKSYPDYWYSPTTMFYIRSASAGCGILCFYNYWASGTKLDAYEKEVWFFGAGKSETGITFGGSNRDINDYFRIYIDTANCKYYMYYNRYNDLSLRILELLFFTVPEPGEYLSTGALRSSFFTNSTTVVDLPTESSTLVRVPIKTTYNHDRTIRTTKSVYASSFYENSDIRLKENVRGIDLSDLTKLVDLVQFNFKDSGTKKYGVIAQLLELVGLQNLVYENNGNKAVDYISLLVLEIQRLRNEIGELKLEINKKS